jgi:hypothetical protein
MQIKESYQNPNQKNQYQANGKIKLRSAYGKVDLKDQMHSIESDESELYNSTAKQQPEKSGVFKRCLVYLTVGAALLGGGSATGVVSFDKAMTFYKNAQTYDKAYDKVKSILTKEGDSPKAGNETIDNKIQGGN